MKKKYCETLKEGFYLIEGDRCIYASGTTKGNKWIDLSANEQEWSTLMWNCISPYEIEEAVYYKVNPLTIKTN